MRNFSNLKKEKKKLFQDKMNQFEPFF